MLHGPVSLFGGVKNLNFNPVAKAFIVSEAFFWSAWSILMPLISVFALTEVSNATVQSITFAYSVYLLLRVLGSVGCGVFLPRLTVQHKLLLIICVILFMNISYLGFVTVATIGSIYIFYGIAGFFTGLITPLRSTLFSTHLDKQKEVIEWGMLDIIILTTLSIASAISGMLISAMGYKSVFIFSAVLNSLSVVPYMYLYKNKKA